MLSKYTVISPYFFLYFSFGIHPLPPTSFSKGKIIHIYFPLSPLSKILQSLFSRGSVPTIKCLNADFSFLHYLFIFKRIYLDIFGQKKKVKLWSNSTRVYTVIRSFMSFHDTPLHCHVLMSFIPFLFQCITSQNFPSPCVQNFWDF